MPELKDELDKPEQPEHYYRQDEGDRIARAKRWMEQARGLTANLQPGAKGH